MRMTALFIVLVATVAARAEFYEVEWEHWDWRGEAIVNTDEDSLMFTFWDPRIPRGYGPEVGDIWRAVSVLDEPIFDPERMRHILVGPYDIPDDWDGTLDGWGFLAPEPFFTTLDSYVPGFGGYSGSDEIAVWGVFEGTIGSKLRWPEFYPNQTGGEWLWADETATRVNVYPVSPTRLVGDVDLDGRFDSSDMVRVFTSGLYETGRPAVWSDGDWTGNGVFDSGDMIAAFVGGAYESTAAFGVRSAVVPEPSAIVLAAIGFFFVLRGRVF